MEQFAYRIQSILNAPVFDRTGLSGQYYFDVGFANNDDVAFPDLIAAVKDLGLKLERQRGPVEFLVIDHIAKAPTEN